MRKPVILLVAAAVAVSACASPRTKAQHRAALDECLASSDPRYSDACVRADILREQMEYEREENTALAFGAAALGVLTLGIVAAVNDDCCHYHPRYRARYHHRGHRHRGRHYRY